MNRISLVFCGLLICSGCAGKPEAGPASKTPGATGSPAVTASASASPSASSSPSGSATPSATVPDLKPFKAADGTFTISFPGDPKVNAHTGKGGLQSQFMVDFPDGTTYAVVVNHIPKISDKAPSESEMLKEAVKGLNKFFGPSAKLLSEKEVKVAGNTGVEYSFTMEADGKKVTLTSRTFFAHESHLLFQILAGGPNKVDTEKFFNTFELGGYPPKGEGTDSKGTDAKEED